jgi:ribosome-binding protein aMBF1 (putative translation factor)
MNVSNEVHRQRKIENSDSLKPKSLSFESRNTITQMRAVKRLTQEQLNISCRFPKNTIRDIENGKLIPHPKQLGTINSILGISVKLS